MDRVPSRAALKGVGPYRPLALCRSQDCLNLRHTTQKSVSYTHTPDTTIHPCDTTTAEAQWPTLHRTSLCTPASQKNTGMTHTDTTTDTKDPSSGQAHVQSHVFASVLYTAANRTIHQRQKAQQLSKQAGSLAALTANNTPPAHQHKASGCITSPNNQGLLVRLPCNHMCVATPGMAACIMPTCAPVT